MRAVFEDAGVVASLPSALTTVVLPNDNVTGSDYNNENVTPVSEAATRAFRDTEGLMALCRAMAAIKARSPGFAAIAEACRDQYLAETGDSLEDDLFADFADAP